jgi:hypothetical protein
MQPQRYHRTQAILQLSSLIWGTLAMLLLVILALRPGEIAPATQHLLTTLILLSIASLVAIPGARLLGSTPPLFHRAGLTALIAALCVPLSTIIAWLPLSRQADAVVNILVIPSTIVIAIASNWNALLLRLQLPAGNRLAMVRWITVSLTQITAVLAVIGIWLPNRSVAYPILAISEILGALAIVSGTVLAIIHRRHSIKLATLGL